MAGQVVLVLVKSFMAYFLECVFCICSRGSGNGAQDVESLIDDDDHDDYDHRRLECTLALVRRGLVYAGLGQRGSGCLKASTQTALQDQYPYRVAVSRFHCASRPWDSL